MDKNKPIWRIVKAGEKPPRIVTEAFVPLLQCLEKMIRSDQKSLEKKLRSKK